MTRKTVLPSHRKSEAGIQLEHCCGPGWQWPDREKNNKTPYNTHRHNTKQQKRKTQHFSPWYSLCALLAFVLCLCTFSIMYGIQTVYNKTKKSRKSQKTKCRVRWNCQHFLVTQFVNMLPYPHFKHLECDLDFFSFSVFLVMNKLRNTWGKKCVIY